MQYFRGKGSLTHLQMAGRILQLCLAPKPSTLANALERDEEFVESVLRSSEADPHLRLEWLESVAAGSSVTRVHVKGRCGSHSKKFSKTLLVKRQSEKRRPRDPVLCNEASMFGRVLPTLRQWVSRTGMAAKDLLPFPSCLYASTTVIVMEDIVARGFSTGDILKGLQLDHSVAALQALGRFHAVSLSLKQQDRSAFDMLVSQLQEVVFVPDAAPIFGASTESALELAITCLKHCPEQVISDAVHMLQSLRGRTFPTLMSLVAPKEPLSVICHGDFWINNVMFSYKNGKIVELALTDLQVVRYSSPATDLLHFLYTSLEPGLLRDYGDELLKVYHNSLSETVSKLSPQGPPPPTLDDILGEIESHALYGLLMSFLVLPNIADCAKTLDDPSEYSYTRFSHSYSQSVKEIVLKFVEKRFI